MAAILEGNRLTLTGDVGDFGWGDYFTHGDVVLALAQIDDEDDLVVFINSGGGIATEGAAIFALLGRRSGTTDVTVDGIAASAASLIAMAGDTITMSVGSTMMVHDPSGITNGNSAEHSKTIEGLEALATAFARAYASKTGKTVEECREIMKEERWFTAEEAVAEGFADAVGQQKAKPVAAFAYHQVYAHAPKKLVAMAKAKDWRRPSASAPAASAAQPSQPKETTMTDKERADQLAAELAELKALMKSNQDADAAADMQQELETLRAEKQARETADAIMALEEAQGREEQAKALADAGISVEKAKAIMAATPKADAGVLEQRRLNGEGLNGKGGSQPSAKGDKSVLAAAVARTNKRR
ncbi:ATP-dependent protease ClpP protease subunit [Pseudorhizobium tarimense]|uniref:ATP-dependent Clp protease proteolytic subunit n=1 Tax=Pseudorhizobium tarimense TaxID=1079109 RepID=A0ABV2H2R2_9HYPH|nr:head maturation protease, ClpP-related [Pseudorhizobium tarimense]MCJ8517817.1 ATP-dependent Clp protease proteolytic subunit [Pseudorhizobium tarimense]